MGVLEDALKRSATVVLDPNKVFIAEYNPCTYESAFGIISIHRTIQGAYDAMEKHKAIVTEHYDSPPQSWEVWRVKEAKVLE